jgi:branched-chain amino acid aminotransferase
MKLIDIERDWICDKEGFSLYIRPLYFSTSTNLDYTLPTSAKLIIFCSPVGPYFKTGFSAVNIYADKNFIRCSPGGTGGYKLGSNYALSIKPEK